MFFFPLNSELVLNRSNSFSFIFPILRPSTMKRFWKTDKTRWNDFAFNVGQLLWSIQRLKTKFFLRVLYTVFSNELLLGLYRMKSEVLCFQFMATNISLPQSVSGARLVLLNNSQSVSNLVAYTILIQIPREQSCLHLLPCLTMSRFRLNASQTFVTDEVILCNKPVEYTCSLWMSLSFFRYSQHPGYETSVISAVT